jgi:hypothetical protein
MSVMFRGYSDANLWKIFAELSYFYRQIYAKQVSKVMMQKLEKEFLILIRKMKKIFLPGWFNAMQHLLVHLLWEAKVGGPAQFRWMYSQGRELKKLIVTVHNRARVEGCIVEAFVCKEIMNFSSKYFSCANNVNAHTMRYHIVENEGHNDDDVIHVYQEENEGHQSLSFTVSDGAGLTELAIRDVEFMQEEPGPSKKLL